MDRIEEILGNEEAIALREDVNDAICDGADYEEIEDIMLGYGLEMDYIEEVLF